MGLLRQYSLTLVLSFLNGCQKGRVLGIISILRTARNWHSYRLDVDKGVIDKESNVFHPSCLVPDPPSMRTGFLGFGGGGGELFRIVISLPVSISQFVWKIRPLALTASWTNCLWF